MGNALACKCLRSDPAIQRGLFESKLAELQDIFPGTNSFMIFKNPKDDNSSNQPSLPSLIVKVPKRSEEIGTEIIESCVTLYTSGESFVSSIQNTYHPVIIHLRGTRHLFSLYNIVGEKFLLFWTEIGDRDFRDTSKQDDLMKQLLEDFRVGLTGV